MTQTQKAERGLSPLPEVFPGGKSGSEIQTDVSAQPKLCRDRTPRPGLCLDGTHSGGLTQHPQPNPGTVPAELGRLESSPGAKDAPLPNHIFPGRNTEDSASAKLKANRCHFDAFFNITIIFISLASVVCFPNTFRSTSFFV